MNSLHTPPVPGRSTQNTTIEAASDPAANSPTSLHNEAMDDLAHRRFRPHIGQIHWLGVWTLYKKEVWRFMKVWNQTVLAPVVTTLLFLAVLVLAIGESRGAAFGGQLPFEQFVAPGLIMMAVVQNAFANTSSSLMLAKIQGVIIDILMPPFKGWETTCALVAGGVTRGVAVALSVGIATYCFVPFSMYSPTLALFYLISASLLMAALGMLAGVIAQTFDQMAAFTNYVVTPLAFLSGTFYSIERLPQFWQDVSHVNPFFYMIDGFRYAMTGYADGNIQMGIFVMLSCNLFILWLVQHLFGKGWRLKS